MPQALERADGSWAWVVLLATMVTQGLTLGFPTCIGIFFTDLQWEFQASNSQTSWIPSILMAVLHMAGEWPGEELMRKAWGLQGSHNPSGSLSGLLVPSL